ncbi:Universal stress protein family protein [Nakamurella panacisegetis]|uniref:Universal stress protein family protein n=1 Tax=Nakamurella panacisegetis TaxID=1090615 RepID=A0A1H0SY73_9ACTN|nr:universal stress protein [Nakamurella panacisegetis]SDP46188.1 Universal stress protein family protein [Nakamurella panacisegetis]
MTGRIVVGWTDSAEAHAALDWAVHQALLTGRSVTLAHEMTRGATGTEDPGNAWEVEAKARRRVEAIRRTVVGEFPDLEFQPVVEWGEPGAGLLRWSRSADILAVGAPPNRHLRMLGALTDHLAAAAESPVALVPRTWRGNSRGARTVAVGATSSPGGRAALKFASHEAIRMTASLVAVIGADRHSEQARAILQNLEHVENECPGLPIEIHWEKGDVAPALIRISQTSQIVVLGTHHSPDRWSIRLGPVTDLVLGHTACPVITVARLRARSDTELVGSG